ncbi:MAG: hypothetical protein Q9222_003983 [Ikaeria aurantiellina]
MLVIAERPVLAIITFTHVENKMDSSVETSKHLKSTATPVYKPTVEAYDQWAATYDTDGNFLQALDSIEVTDSLLPSLINLMPSSPRIVDLGCGTGRTTLSLLRIPDAEILGLDNSMGMLNIARARCNEKYSLLLILAKARSVTFDVWDILCLQDGTNDVPASIKVAPDAIVSTLVIEHIPLKVFFDACSRILQPEGLLLLTNMHSDMGLVSQAGFVDPATGNKIRPTSYIHTVAEVLEEAKAWKFEPLQRTERAVSEDNVQQLGVRARKWVGTKVWFGMIFKKTR